MRARTSEPNANSVARALVLAEADGLKGHGLSHVRAEQFDFLCGFFGGRRYYEERHGHMNLREIHAHVEIRREDAENWLAVMDLAMTDTGVEEPMKSQIAVTFRRAAMMLVNRV